MSPCKGQHRRKKGLLALGIMLMVPGLCQPGAAQSLTGTTGLVTIPTAEMPEDRSLAFGVSFFSKKFQPYGRRQYHLIPYFASIGYLPFLEVGLRATRRLDLGRGEGLGDRMVSARLRLLSQRNRTPALVLGVHDFLTGSDGQTTHFNALYLVASRHFRLAPLASEVGLHLGYGTDWMKARHYQFVGLFGGVSVSPTSDLTLMLEYDSERFSGGLRMMVLDHVALLAAWQGFAVFSGGVSYRLKL